MLLYTEGYDRKNLQSEECSQVMMFFALREKVLLVQHTGEYCPSVRKKYIEGYRYHRRAMETMHINRSTKQFSLDPIQVSECGVKAQ